MTLSRYLGICAFALAGAFAGSFAANHGLTTVHAQTQMTTDLRGRSLTLVNPQGRTVATLRAGGSGAELVLSGNQSARVEIDGSGAISIHNPAGRLIWSAPPKTGVIPASE